MAGSWLSRSSTPCSRHRRGGGWATASSADLRFCYYLSLWLRVLCVVVCGFVRLRICVFVCCVGLRFWACVYLFCVLVMRLCIFVFRVSVCCYCVNAFVCGGGGIFGGIWESLGSIWKHSLAFGSIWNHLKAFGSTWKHLETFLGAFGNTWEHLRTLGSIWEHLGSTWSIRALILAPSGFEGSPNRP